MQIPTNKLIPVLKNFDRSTACQRVDVQISREENVAPIWWKPQYLGILYIPESAYAAL